MEQKSELGRGEQRGEREKARGTYKFLCSTRRRWKSVENTVGLLVNQTVDRMIKDKEEEQVSDMQGDA